MSLAPRETAFDDRGHVAQAVSFAQAGIFLFPQLHIGSIRKSIPAQNVDGWVVGLNERLGIVPTPVGAIFLIGFGHGLHGADQSAMQLGGGQFRASYLMPCSIAVWVPISTQ